MSKLRLSQAAEKPSMPGELVTFNPSKAERSSIKVTKFDSVGPTVVETAASTDLSSAACAAVGTGLVGKKDLPNSARIDFGSCKVTLSTLNADGIWMFEGMASFFRAPKRSSLRSEEQNSFQLSSLRRCFWTNKAGGETD